jgi:hypothetical protein
VQATGILFECPLRRHYLTPSIAAYPAPHEISVKTRVRFTWMIVASAPPTRTQRQRQALLRLGADCLASAFRE